MAEILPVLGQDTLQHALIGLHNLLQTSNSSAHQKLLLWI
jgi:hypothetical protein